ncbi:MAG: T9SS type A sorting domain-containing protein [Muribaculaceae bacterium]|nr:T9SS type A sorting domain-containing protein [Muribaculaceae bacterium]
MKKIFTLLATTCMMASASAAAPQLWDSSAEIVTTPAQRQQLRTMRAVAEFDALHQTNSEQYVTRKWDDPKGGYWTMQFCKEQQPLCELIGFLDKDGNPFNYTFDELPLYCVTYILWKTDTNGNIVTNLSMQLCWPSYYIWNQIFEYPADYEIPIEDRKYDCVTPDDLMNSTTWCNKFVESTGIGGKYTSDYKNWEHFSMLPNQVLDFSGMVNGEIGFTEIGETRSSWVKFNGYNPDNNVVSYDEEIYFKAAQSGKTSIIRNSPTGVARIEGFDPRDIMLPEFGDLHMFNMGVGGTDLGDVEYSDDWGPLSQLYIVACDKYVNVVLPEDTKVFDISKVMTVISEDLPAGDDLDEHANLVKGVLYADKKYSEDTSLNPVGNFKLLIPEIKWDPAFETDYMSCPPIENSFVPFGVGLNDIEGWSEKYGMSLRVQNFFNYFGTFATMGIGTTEGYQFTCDDYYGNIVRAKSNMNCIYHYDPKDVNKVRNYSLVGDIKYESSVDVVVADNANVTAQNGTITVSVAEDSNVCVYSVAGAVVANANVKAGNSLNANVEKGIYVVVVNGKSTKVAL